MDTLKLFIANAIEQEKYSTTMNGLLNLVVEDKMIMGKKLSLPYSNAWRTNEIDWL